MLLRARVPDPPFQTLHDQVERALQQLNPLPPFTGHSNDDSLRSFSRSHLDVKRRAGPLRPPYAPPSPRPVEPSSSPPTAYTRGPELPLRPGRRALGLRRRRPVAIVRDLLEDLPVHGACERLAGGEEAGHARRGRRHLDPPATIVPGNPQGTPDPRIHLLDQDLAILDRASRLADALLTLILTVAIGQWY